MVGRSQKRQWWFDPGVSYLGSFARFRVSPEGGGGSFTEEVWCIEVLTLICKI